ncbi:MAG: hypothetical protein R3257_04985 [bacterium]|nr:hypothetical protein [bacterium]
MRVITILALLFFFLGVGFVEAQARRSAINPGAYGFTHRNAAAAGRIAPGQPVYPLRQNMPLYNPYFSPNFGPLYEPYDEPCHYDESVGMWVGPCTTGLDTPGFSITVPNRVR